MRYYNIQLSGSSGVFGSGWTSHPNGTVADPGAQEVLMTLEAYNGTADSDNGMTPSDASNIEIKGVSWDQIKASNQLIGQPISVSGGMMPGLPLATAQSVNRGPLVTGRIQKTWGNWVGTDMSLGISFIAAVDSAAPATPQSPTGSSTSAPTGSSTSAPPAPQRFNRTGSRSLDRMNLPRGRDGTATIVSAGVGLLGGVLSELEAGAASVNVNGIISSFLGGGFPGLTQPINLIHNMLPNVPLSSAIQQTLSTAFPGLPLNIAISPLLKLAYQDAGVYQSIHQYASYILPLSKTILGSKNYLGVHISVDNNTVHVWDGTVPQGFTNIRAIDLIGQPTWVDKNVIEIKVVMRAGLKLGGTVTIPPGTLTSVTPNSVIPLGSQQRTNLTMEGITGTISKITHVGDFRNPDGNYWCTIIRALVPNPPAVPTIPPPPVQPGTGTGTGTSAPLRIDIPLTPGNITPAPQRLLTRSVRRY
jgi:hypothetical protein